MPPQLNIPGSDPQPSEASQPAPESEPETPPKKKGPEVRSLRPAGEKPEDRPTQRVFSSYQTGAVPTVPQPISAPVPTHTASVTAHMVIPSITAEQPVVQSNRLPGWVFSLIGGVSGFVIAMMMVSLGMLNGPLGITEDKKEAVEAERERIVEILESDRVDIEIYEGFKPEEF
ncbi:hypothetical protein [Sulfuriroseicoccus oceanibius]|uniref:Uncharacterized protein n=1 Tax=Sulfuriroseicoccus oceanibius TaxID=2707525 RepID=A0A6B3LCQ2_9BACT|nr:hypothetical protein [Sulfuriroseicoccus oceanibius]QQL44036.1 hypothetical protein G3M56_009025 [Sulfuriroseicoccus oceanibius]